MKTHPLSIAASVAVLSTLLVAASSASQPAYNGRVNSNVERDRIIAIAQDYASMYYYVGPANVDYSTYTGATCPDTTPGWKLGAKYCWGGYDTPAIYLQRIAAGDGAGNKNTSGTSSYGTYAAGVDCSGMSSNTWTSSRLATSGMPSISDDVTYEQLRMGDCTNDAGSHIRVFDYFVGDVNTLMSYESTSGSGLLWRDVHRSLARDNGYQPIRYNNPSGYGVNDYPEPTISYIKRTGIERFEVRWDGQADTGFRLYESTDGTTWTQIRSESDLTPGMRTCEVSGVLPQQTIYFRMTAVNTGGETIQSDVASVRADGFAPRFLLVDGADRGRRDTGASNTFMTRLGAAVGSEGAGFDFTSNEAVVDEQIDLGAYQGVVWILADESTFDETFTWTEQKHVMKYLENGGRLFVSGSEIGWDLQAKANSTTYKNGHENDQPFYNTYLRASYVDDDSATYQVTGQAGSIFDGITLSFDDGTHGTYDVTYPDIISASNGSTTGFNYVGGSGGVAGVYGSDSTDGTVVNLGFGFESIYPESARQLVMHAVLDYFDVPVEPPVFRTATQTGEDAVTLTWDGHASEGFRVLQRSGSGAWTEIRDETQLDANARSTVVTGLTAGMLCDFKVQAVNSTGPSADSDVLVASIASGKRILVVDGFDRWNDLSGGTNQTFLQSYGDAIAVNGARCDSCTNEAVADGTIRLGDYAAVMWMSGEESTAQETFSAIEQTLVQDYLKAGGQLFSSGSEIGWDLAEKANTANDYSNGSANDNTFYQDFLKASHIQDDAGSYAANGVSGSIFEGLSVAFDDGTHGTYDVKFPDVIAAQSGAAGCLLYGGGSTVAAVSFEGNFAGGSADGRLVYMAFPFETIYDTSTRNAVMDRILGFFQIQASDGTAWMVY